MEPADACGNGVCCKRQTDRKEGDRPIGMLRISHRAPCSHGRDGDAGDKWAGDSTACSKVSRSDSHTGTRHDRTTDDNRTRRRSTSGYMHTDRSNRRRTSAPSSQARSIRKLPEC
jgi:hypothetical protein